MKLYRISLFSLLILLSTGYSIHSQNMALLFDGSSGQSLNIENKGQFDITENGFTLEAWIFANSWANESWRGSIITNDGQGPDRGFAFRCGDNGKLSFVMSADGTWNEVASASIMNTKQWHHVALVINQKNMTLYVDGQSVATNSYTGTYRNNTANLSIAASAGFDGRFFDGVIDEVRVWQVARSEQEIFENRTSNLSGSEAGLVIYLPLNDGAGSTAINLSDSNCPATGIGVTDNNWVEGYSLPDFDLSVSDLSGLDRINMKTRPIKPSCKIQNTGTEPISNYDIDLYLNGVLTLSETGTNEILPGEVENYVFKAPVDLTDQNLIELEVEVSHADDANGLNNKTSLQVSNQPGPTVNLFQNEVHNFGAAGQNQNLSMILPSDLSIYEQILLHVNLSCPSGGCDPWDQPAKVNLVNSQGIFEIARYITPFGIACGDWTVDVTDFKDMLSGEIMINSFIQVWGPSGWSATIDLEFIDSDPGKIYSQATPLWNRDYIVYGDPGISYDLEPINFTADNNTQNSHLRLHLTGHGQGNTNNAAEFFEATHSFWINGSLAESHNLWKADCPQNECANQAGTWLFPRAGWCPGQEVEPKIFNTSSALVPGEEVVLDYQFEEYTNLLNTGYNSSGHTEPHFRFHSYLVELSEQPYNPYRNAEAFQVIPEISDNDLILNFDIINNGTEELGTYTTNFYLNNELVLTEAFSNAILANAELSLNVTIPNAELLENNVVFAEIIAAGDMNAGDNIVKSNIFSVSNKNISSSKDLKVYPNPSSAEFILESQDNETWKINILNMHGSLIHSLNFGGATQRFTLPENGTYILTAKNAKGDFITKKLVIID